MSGADYQLPMLLRRSSAAKRAIMHPQGYHAGGTAMRQDHRRGAADGQALRRAPPVGGPHLPPTQLRRRWISKNIEKGLVEEA